jgi:hypothetical protein
LLRLPPRTTDVAMAPDGRRFLLVQREGEELVASELDVIVNWFRELSRKR